MSNRVPTPFSVGQNRAQGWGEPGPKQTSSPRRTPAIGSCLHEELDVLRLAPTSGWKSPRMPSDALSLDTTKVSSVPRPLAIASTGPRSPGPGSTSSSRSSWFHAMASRPRREAHSLRDRCRRWGKKTRDFARATTAKPVGVAAREMPARSGQQHGQGCEGWTRGAGWGAKRGRSRGVNRVPKTGVNEG